MHINKCKSSVHAVLREMWYLLVFMHDVAAWMTVQMVHVSCQLSDGAPLVLVKRKYVFAHGRHYDTRPYLAALSLAKG